jgi:hypothetical protein
MGKQKNIQLSGTYGDVVYYTLNGVAIMRARPAHVARSEASKAAALNFGLANKTGKALRSLLLPILPPVTDKRKLRINFVTAINRWLNTTPLNNNLPTGALPFISGYEFNERSALAERLRVPLTVTRTADNKFTLHIPAFNPVEAITAPANTITVVCIIMAAACNMDDAVATGSFTTQLTIPYTNALLPAQDMELDISTAPRCLTVVAAALYYYTGTIGNENAVRDLRWLPVGIVEGMYN